MESIPLSNTDFDALAESAEFVAFSGVLKRLAGLALGLNDPIRKCGRNVLTLHTGNPICGLIHADPEGARRCHACDQQHYLRAAAQGKSLLYTCHAGFLDMAVLVVVEGRHVATVSSGQVLTEPHSPAGFQTLRRRLAWLKTSQQKLRRAYDQAPYLPKARVQDIMRLLEVFANQLCQSARRIRELKGQLERDEIRRAKKLVEERFSDPSLGLRDAARLVKMSPNYFSHLFRQETGGTFTRFVQARRVAEAKRLLAATDDSVTVVGAACGFNSLVHFKRVFLAVEGRSPRDYRRSV